MSLKTDIKLGNPPGIEVSLSDVPYVLVNATETDKGMLECISDNLKHRTKINLALSGGIDSQFSLQCCLSLNKEITAYTYRSFWKGSVINAEDVYIAEQLAKEYNFKHHVIDIELKEFYDNLTHFKYSTNFFNTSPQLSVHFYFIEELKKLFNIDHIMLGGDPTLFTYNKLPGNNFRLSGEGFYQDHMAPYYLLCDSLGIECLRDTLNHSPEGVYAGFKNNLDVVKNKKIFLKNEHYKEGTYVYKTEYYKNVFPNMRPQVSGTTGFENLKKILASETGVYNQYDILYRVPQSDLVPKFIRNRIKSNTTSGGGTRMNIDRLRNVKYDPIIKEIYLEYLKFIDTNDCKNVTTYNFDF